MKPHARLTRLTTVLGLTVLLLPLPAHAYIDPNTGGFLFQLFAPLFALAISAWLLFADKVKLLWMRIKKLFGIENQDN